MKIVCIAYLHGFGGAEKQIIMLANGLADLGHSVTLISVSDDKACYAINNHVNYITEHDKGLLLFRLISRYRFLRGRLKDIKPDVTINYWYQSVYLLAAMPKNITGRIIYSERGDPGDKEYTGVLGLLRRITIHKVDGVVFQSEGARDFFDRLTRDKSIIIHNPISVIKGDYSVPNKRKKQIINVGRLHPQKNQKLLIKAFSLIADKIPEYILEIYGEGELEDELQELIDSLNLTEKIHIHKSTSEILSIINESALFVLTSDYEGMPNALMEAMALGVPCVSTDCKPGGAKTLIKNRENGFLVSRNNPSELAKVILERLTYYEETREIGIKAQSIMETHSKDCIYKSWEKYIKDTVQGRIC